MFALTDDIQNNLKGKRLLILGGVPAMIEAVKFAQCQGIEVLVTDYLENSPAKKYADKSFMVSTTDIDAVVRLCKEEKVDGIFTGNVDMLLPYYAKICELTGLPCYATEEHFDIMTDKIKFKKLCKAYNVPTVTDYTNEEIRNNDISYPVIVKPIDSSGSKGISVCNNYDELNVGIEKALYFSPSKQYIVERYMTGDEVVLYYYFQDGNPVFMGMCDRYVNKEQEGVAQLPTAYIFPSKFTKSHIDLSDHLIKKMYKQIKITNGTTFLQAFIERDIAYLYEPGYRLNGAREHYIYSAVTGINAMEMLINFSLTGKMSNEDISKKSDPYIHGKFACKLSPLIKPGIVSKIEGIDFLSNIPEIVEVIMNNNIGDEITSANVGTLKQVAYRAFIVSDTKERLKEIIDFVQDNVRFYNQNNESMMLKQFDTHVLMTDY